MFELTQNYIVNTDVEQLASLDLSAFAKLPTFTELASMPIEDEKRIAIISNLEQHEMKGDVIELPSGLTSGEETDPKEYISINILREKIEELGIRYIDENFKLGKKAWNLIIENLGLGYNDNGTYVFYDNINDCYKAEHPRSGQIGFNVLCLDQFWEEWMQPILSVKIVVDIYLEDERVAAYEAKRAEAKRRSNFKTTLGGVYHG